MTASPLTKCFLLLASALGAFLSCDEPTGSRPDVCEQTYEFGNYGCAKLEVEVVGAAGQPIPYALGGADCRDCNTVVAPADEQGFFNLRLTKFSPLAEPTEVSIRASRLSPFRVTDSVRVLIHFTRLGEVPPTTQVRLQLPIPLNP